MALSKPEKEAPAKELVEAEDNARYINGSTYLWTGPSANEFILKEAPPTIRYIRSFITEEEEELFLMEVNSAPKPKWQQLLHRRLQNWGGIVGKKGLIPDGDIPKWLGFAINKVMSVPDSFPENNRPNHVLINEYQPGQGIMAHTDGPAFYPLIATVSLGSDSLIDYYKPIDQEQKTEAKGHRYVGSVLLERRSLLLVSDEAYSYFLHEIGERTFDVMTRHVFNREIAGKKLGDVISRDLRVSLTIRNVPRVCKLDIMNRLMNNKKK